MKKIVLVLVMVIVISMVSMTVLSGCKKGNKEVNYEKSGLYGPQTNESIVGIMNYSDSSTQEELKALVERVYNNACRLDQNLPYRRLNVECAVDTVGTMMQYVTTIKNGTEYVRLETQVPDGENNNALIKSILKGMVYFKADYADLSYDKAVRIESKKDISYNDGNIGADLGDVSVTYIDKPYYNASQEPLYTQTDFVINRDTIYDISISHNDSECYYIIELNIDVNNAEAIAKPLENMSGSVNNAKYISVREHIEIWDSGYFRAFHSLDNWKGNVSILSIDGNIDYRTYFVYDEDECDINSCFGIAKCREEIAKQ